MDAGTPDRTRAAIFAALVVSLLIAQDYFGGIDTRFRDRLAAWRMAVHDPTPGAGWPRLRGFFPIRPFSDDLVVVMLDDDAALNIPEKQPWNRRMWASLIDAIASGQPRAIGLDVFFGQPAAYDPEQDQELVRAVLAAKRVVVRSYRSRPETVTLPFPGLANRARTAPVYFYPYLDDSIRKTSLVFHPNEGSPVPAFPIALLAQAYGFRTEDVGFGTSEITIPMPAGELRVPVVDGENLLINFDALPGTARTVSLADVYHARIDPGIFRDRIVLIGCSNSLVEDRHFTPIGTLTGSAIQAMALHNLLARSYLRPPIPGLAWLIGVGLLALFWFDTSRRVGPAPLIGIALLVIGTLIGAGAWLFLFRQQSFGVAGPVFATLCGLGEGLWRRYAAEQAEKARIKHAFQHYVTASVVNEILKDPSKLELHGVERILTVFFSDIVRFTTVAEGLQPIKVVELLNEYLTEMTEVIFRYDGLLDKYEGDAIMAVFGAPLDQTDHAVRGCRCALDQQKVLAAMRERWRREGKPPMSARMGIHTGLVVVGNMGSKMRFDYTVIGDNVNLAARLETGNKMFASDILVSGDTARLVQGHILTRRLGVLRVLGRTQPVEIHEALAALDDLDQRLLARQRLRRDRFQEAFELVRGVKLQDALKLLDRHLLEDPEDGPAQALSLKARTLAEDPALPPWDGVWIQGEK